MNTDETRIQKTRRLYSTLLRPKLRSNPTFRPVAFNSLSNWASSRLSYWGIDLYFDRHTVINDQISIVIADNYALVLHANAFFDLGGKTTPTEFNLQSPLINSFKKSISKLAMHFKCGSHDRLSNRSMHQFFRMLVLNF
jgi:hypothetical protein